MSEFASKWLPTQNGTDKTDERPRHTTSVSSVSAQVTSESVDIGLADAQGITFEPSSLHIVSSPRPEIHSETYSDCTDKTDESLADLLDSAWFDRSNPVPVPVHELSDAQVRALARCGKRYQVEPTPRHLLPAPLLAETGEAA